MTYPRLISLLTLAGFLALTLAVGWLGSSVTIPQIDGWYADIAKSSLNPPRWVFAPAWTSLYILMAVAAWLVTRSGAEGRRDALTLWGLQLALNCAWSFLFFGLQRPDLALIDILFLDLAILGCMASFYRIFRPAFWLLVPYIAWTLFATFLNFEVWRLN